MSDSTQGQVGNCRYTVGGTILPSSKNYIKRKADDELLALCQAGKLAYILSARQVGKSSLIVRMERLLEEDGIHSVIIDFNVIGTKLEQDQWYQGILELIDKKLDLKTDIFDWWAQHARLGPTQRLTTFFRDVLLKEVTGRVVLFFDEIDSTLSIPFSDDFFAALRAVFNERAINEDFMRLSFVLVGTATPDELMSDCARTPFNIGQRVELTDFTLKEALPLAGGFRGEQEQVMSWILDWTGGYPFLTQLLCAHLFKSKEEITEDSVARAVVELRNSKQENLLDDNLQYVREMLLKRAPNVRKVLEYYREILKGRPVPDDERSIPILHLKISGVVRREHGYLVPRNRIYQQVFDLAWIEKNKPKERIWKRLPIWVRAIAITCLAGIVITAAVIISKLPSLLPPTVSSSQTLSIAKTETPTISEIPTDTPVPSAVSPISTHTFTPAPAIPTALPIEITDAAGISMRLVPAGEFTMGSVSGYIDELPLHSVYLDAFYMDTYEVSIAEYQSCVDADACFSPLGSGHPWQINKNHPIVFVTWEMAHTYCEWRGARLPTEAEWEKAAGGTDERTYPWSDEDIRCKYTNYYRCENHTMEVGKYEAGKSPYGIYDLAGNVWEWVADWYDAGYYSSLKPGVSNPQGPLIGYSRVLRGGSWMTDIGNLRVANRFFALPSTASDDIGFRCARDVSP